MNGCLHEHLKLALSSPSLSQLALISHGSLSHGSGTINFYNVIDFVIMIYGVHYMNMTRAILPLTIISYNLILLEQLNPSPSVNGSLHEHVKFALSSPSLSQSALISHGSLSHGSGTIYF